MILNGSIKQCCAVQERLRLAFVGQPTEPRQSKEEGWGWIREPPDRVGDSLKACATFIGFQESFPPPKSPAELLSNRPV